MKKMFLITTILLLIGAAAFVWTPVRPQDSDRPREIEGQAGDPIIYESEVESPDECTSYEVYDPVQKVCTFECASEAECQEIEMQVDAELQKLAENYESGSKKTQDEAPIESDSPTKQVEYQVSPDEQITRISGSSDPQDVAIWNQIKALSPDDFTARYINTFQIFNAPNDDTLAFVDDENGDGYFRIAVNRPQHSRSTRDEQVMTLVHELGHILTLNRSQIATDQTACTYYQTDEGCFGKGSILGDFAQRYWPIEMQQAAKDQQIAYTETGFVTEYATSNPEEDLAESFAYFVVSTKSSTAQIKDQKIQFFASYPPAVSLKTSMRAAIASSIVRARKAL